MNIYETDSDNLISVSGNTSTLESSTNSSQRKSDILIERGNAKFNKGRALLENISVISTNWTTHKLTIQMLGYPEMKAEFLLEILPCSRGDYFSNDRCIPCSEGYFSLDDEAISNCEKCPENAVCPGRDRINPNSGFWRMNENSSQISECIRD